MAAPSTAELILGFIFLAIVVLAVVAWGRLVVLNKAGKSLQPYAPRTSVPWGLIDLFGVGVIYVLFQFLALTISLGPDLSDGAIDDLDLDQQLPVMMMFAVGSMATLFASVLFVRLRTRATNEDLGISPVRWAFDFRSALMIFSLMIIPILALQFLLQQLSDEPTHPLVKMLLESSTPTFFIVSSVVAVIVAPLIEEFLFRVLIQGWLENLAMLFSRGQDQFTTKQRQQLVLGGRLNSPKTATVAEDAAPVESDSPKSSRNPYLTPADATSRSKAASNGDTNIGDELLQPQPAVWPIVVSAMIFALAHFGHGTDPIPLFFFALGLGWLYQRTHRMWPCVLVHMMLNGLSMLQLFFYLQTLNQ